MIIRASQLRRGSCQWGNLHSGYWDVVSSSWCVMALVSNICLVDFAVPVEHPLLAPVSVAAGYPSPSQDYFDGRINLNDHLIIL